MSSISDVTPGFGADVSIAFTLAPFLAAGGLWCTLMETGPAVGTRRTPRADRAARPRTAGLGLRDRGPALIGPALVAPDTFKGTFAATEVAAAVARGLRASGIEAVELPVADGGEGTLEALLADLGGELRTATVSDPLGRAVEAEIALIEGRETTAVV